MQSATDIYAKQRRHYAMKWPLNNQYMKPIRQPDE